MCRNRVIFENFVLFFDHNYYVLSRRDSLIVNCQLLIVNYKHQFTFLPNYIDIRLPQSPLQMLHTSLTHLRVQAR